MRGIRLDQRQVGFRINDACASQLLCYEAFKKTNLSSFMGKSSPIYKIFVQREVYNKDEQTKKRIKKE